MVQIDHDDQRARLLFETGRAPKMESAVDHIAEMLFDNKREVGLCVVCDAEVKGRESFHDDLSWKEYRISYMCQSCQDSLFMGGGQEELTVEERDTYRDVTQGHQDIVESAYEDEPPEAPQVEEAPAPTSDDE